ncbi:MAG TPA: flagellar biosynthesis protein FlhA [Polyangia bacterium]|nr:flagellar biosynthesis protein FlhA [Polyangia bacterium]
MLDRAVRSRLGRYGDLALAILVVGIVGMMILPLPAVVMDALLSANIAAAVVLLLTSLYVTDAMKIATFPTLLLLTTLFRLALEVSATRLILSRGSAGQVIAAFGHFVVGGNLVVGVVIFLILTLIQFVVITKGAERVAEVAARFTLDAMPGAQLGIDAELRAGHIDAAAAQRRRAALGRESQLFGSMDGAMKFVKGDAIAGLGILAVNIVGGLVVGILQRGMDAATAARAYSLLTVGAGLVAQIPALLISTAAGIVVTRVSAEEGPSHLGRDIARELGANPKAIGVAALLLGLLALVPGLPAAPFLTLAILLGLGAARLARAAAGAGGDAESARAARLPGALGAPLAIDAAPALARVLGEPGGPLLAREIPAARRRLFDTRGIALPPVLVRARPLPEDTFVFHLHETPVLRATAPAADADAAARAVAAQLDVLLQRHAHELVGIDETQALLDDLQRTNPALVREVVPKVVTPAQLGEVLRRLAGEGVSLRALRDILTAIAALADRPPAERDAGALTEHARGALRRAISYAHTDGNGQILALLLDPLIEDTLRDAIHRTPTGHHLALEPQLSRDIRAAIARALGAARAGSSSAAAAAPVLLTNPELRPFVRRLVENDDPPVTVLSFLELAPEVEVRTLGHVRV